MSTLIDILFRPFRNPWRLLLWWIASSIPIVGPFVLGLMLQCMRDADPAIPKVKFLRLIEDTLLSIALLLEWLIVPYLLSIVILIVSSRTISGTIYAYLFAGAIFFVFAFFLPASFILASRTGWIALNPMAPIRLGLTLDYVKRWFYALIANVILSIITLAITLTGNTWVMYPASTLLLLIDSIIVATIFSFVDTRRF